MPIRQGHASFDLQEGKLWQKAFQDWCDDARRIIRQAKTLEASGHSVEQLDLLRDTLLHCDYDGIDIEELMASAKALDKAKVSPWPRSPMSYNVVLAPTARDKLMQLPSGVAWRIREAMERLCAAPTSLSHPSGFPHPPTFQLFETRIEADGDEYFLKVFFFYSQDEQSLLIDDFVLMPLG